MSDSESVVAVSDHPTLGGKSIESIQKQQDQQNQLQGERIPYKSWRKKYRKMRANFDGVLEQNKRLFKEEQKLEGLAKRLREELDELLDICLDLNQNPGIPSDLRFDIRLPSQRDDRTNVVPEDITPKGANDMMLEYTTAVQQGRMPPLDLHIIREQIQERLAAQEVVQLESLEKTVPQPVPSGEADLPEEMRGEEPQGYLTTDQEADYLLKLDAKMSGDSTTSLAKAADVPPSPNHIDLTPRGLERQFELTNPHSQHNWLKLHTKLPQVVDADDTESLASHETKPPRKRQGKNLAKQVGDRAVGRAREGFSPGAASGFEDDEMVIDENPSAKKRGRADPDGTYRVKGGKGGNAKGKRKRMTEDGEVYSKKQRVSEAFAD